MEIHPKSPHELAAQVIDAHPYFPEYQMGGSATALKNAYLGKQEAITELLGSRVGDEALSVSLEEMYAEGRAEGTVNPLKSNVVSELTQAYIERQRAYGYTEAELVENATHDLNRVGYLDALRSERKRKEEEFKEPLDKLVSERTLTPPEEKGHIEELLQHTVEADSVSYGERARLAQAFPGGNFLYHGLSSSAAVKVLESGGLMNALALIKNEEATAKAEGRDKQEIQRNSGYEGISWSLNGIDALPGDRFHLAGFVASPEMVLKTSEQLAIPSRPAPYEVIQLPGDIDSKNYYELKVQAELFLNISMGESNSVVGNLISLRMAHDRFMEQGVHPEDAHFSGVPQLWEYSQAHSAEEMTETLRRHYTVGADDELKLSPELTQQLPDKEQIPVGAVYIQALLDSGKLAEHAAFHSMQSVKEVIEGYTPEHGEVLIDCFREDRDRLYRKLENFDDHITPLEVAVEDMYFVAPRKDADMWLKVMARTHHRPKGIILYDGDKVRMENFASDFNGDHGSLADELKKILSTEGQSMDWEADILGVKLTDSMRAGHKHHVVGEQYLGKRKSVRKSVEGKLVVA